MNMSDFSIGQTAHLEKTISFEDVQGFAEVTEDKNPIHLDEAYARESMFGQRVVHGILQAGLISAVLGNQLPGPGSVYREQTLTFRKPAFIGDTLTAEVEITEIRERMGLLLMKTTVKNQAGDLLVSGTAKGLVPRK